MKVWGKPIWLKELPPLAGGYAVSVALADYTTIKVGGPAEVMATVGSWEEMGSILRWNEERGTRNEGRVPLTVLGKGSNVMIRDGGVAGVVVVLGKGLDKVEVKGEEIYAEAGAANGTVARAAREAELDGVAFFGGIPGSIGGALRMNAGAYGSETYERLVKLWVMDQAGVVREVEPGFVKPRYRGTELPEGWLYVAGQWQLARADRETIREKMREVNRKRSTTQPLHLPSSGSWFKHAEWKGEKTSAWKLVDAAECRGMRVGGAMVDVQHANFFVNVGNALAKDFEMLSEKVEAQIKERLGVVMEREVRWLGEAE